MNTLQAMIFKLKNSFNLRKLRDNEIPFLRRKLGVVFQDFQLLMDRSVYDNLNFVLEATGQLKSNENKERMINMINY